MVLLETLLDERENYSTISQAPVVDANGVNHTSPGQRPGLCVFDPVAGQRPASASVPNITFVKFHVILSQQIAIFLLECLRAVVFLLVIYVSLQLLQLAPAD